jgi:hypothetical protein
MPYCYKYGIIYWIYDIGGNNIYHQYRMCYTTKEMLKIRILFLWHICGEHGRVTGDEDFMRVFVTTLFLNELITTRWKVARVWSLMQAPH